MLHPKAVWEDRMKLSYSLKAKTYVAAADRKAASGNKATSSSLVICNTEAPARRGQHTPSHTQEGFESQHI